MQRLTESTTATVRLSSTEASGLQALGKRLASSKTWWGSSGAEETDRTIIRLTPAGGDKWELRVTDAVGAIAVGSAQFIVEPKIPNAHLLYLFEHSGHVPRLDPQRTSLAADRTLWNLVAAWFTEAAEAVLRRDLIRDYQQQVEELAFVRGRSHPLPTARALLKGRIKVTCEFDEFTPDNAFNRILLAAARTIARSPVLELELRQRAMRMTLRLDGIGDLVDSDLRTSVDRRTWYYRDALTLGRSILTGTGRALQEGPQAAWSFLIRTPEMVEAGIRQILTDGLAATSAVTKNGLQLTGSTKTLNPDLVFDSGQAIGDVKYKLNGSDWNTSDLYQAVAFATGFRTRNAAVISFSPSGTVLPTLAVGDVRVENLAWQASADTEPSAAGDGLVEGVRRWLQDHARP